MRSVPQPMTKTVLSVNRLWVAASLLGAIALAYANGLRAPFVFDDPESIVDNPTIRSFATALFPPGNSGMTVSGRPLVNLSLALNYALGGHRVEGYHLLNLLIHFCSAYLLFSIAARTLERPAIPERYRREADRLAWAVALIWSVHPLLTVAVTYVIQRAEAMAAVGILLALLGAINVMDGKRPRFWSAVAIAGCFFGVAAKETAVVAPFLALVYDRIFVARSWSDVWSRRWLYAGMLLSWILLAVLVVSAGGRGGSAGFTGLVTPLGYLLSQGWAITVYFLRTLWPHPLIFDHGALSTIPLNRLILPCGAVGVMLCATVWALFRRPEGGWLGVWWFCLLAPTSSIVPVVTQFMGEHRAYLPSAAVIATAVLLVHRWSGRYWRAITLTVAVAAGTATVARNRDFQSESRLWAVTVAQKPDNPRAHHSLALVLLKEGKVPDAIKHFRRATELEPENSMIHYRLGMAVLRDGDATAAEAAFHRALALTPDQPLADAKLGVIRLQQGKSQEAARHFQKALAAWKKFFLAGNKLEADSVGEPEVYNNLGIALSQLSRSVEARNSFKEAVRLEPTNVEYISNLAWLLVTDANPEVRDAKSGLELAQRARATQAQPSVNLLRTLAAAFAANQRWDEAVATAGMALNLAGKQPDQETIVRALRNDLRIYRTSRGP